MRISKDEYKLLSGELVEVGGMDEVPEGATLWNGYNYKTQEWWFEGKKDVRTLEQLREDMNAKKGIPATMYHIFDKN